MSERIPEEIQEALAAPFPPERLGWKPQSVSGNRALAICYIDARDVQDRLDEVLGIAGWQDRYTVLPGGNVMCELSLRVGGEWLAKCDVGGESDQKDAGDREKAAFSDALKRAAVKWGIARYIYRLDGCWVDYDSQRKAIVEPPQLPAWALPKRRTPYDPTPSAGVPGVKPSTPASPENPAPRIEPVPAAAQTTKPALPSPPQTAAELFERVEQIDLHAAKKKWAAEGTVATHMLAWGAERSYQPDLKTWPIGSVLDAYNEAKRFAETLIPTGARKAAKK